MTTMDSSLSRAPESAVVASAGRDDTSSGGDRGSATVEVAVALPALVFLMVIGLWGVTVAGDQVACVDAARAGARAAARGEDPASVRAAVAKAAPPGADIEISRGSAMTQVVVTVAIRPPGSVTLPGLVLRERAEALTEPDAGGDQ
jgi:hypothetical protein